MELLVHVSAPGSRKDDERYRTQLDTYNAFECSNRVNLQPTSARAVATTTADHALDGDNETNLPAESATMASLVEYIDDTLLATSALESQIITSSLRDQYAKLVGSATSPFLYAEQISSGSPHEAPDASTPSPIYVREDTRQPTTESPSARASRHSDVPYVVVREENGLGVAFDGPRQARTSPESHRSKRAKSMPSNQKTHSTSWSGDDVPSQLPSTYSITDGGSSGPAAELPLSAPAHLPADQGVRIGDAQDVSDQHMNPTTAVPAPEPTVPSRMIDRVESTATDKPPTASQQPSLPKPLQDPKILSDLRSLANTLTPPAPPTSSTPFTTHVTPPLQALSTNPDLQGRYKPAVQTRALRPSERGFWRIDTEPWDQDPDLQLEFWRFLERMVGSGSLGWGVWVCRGECAEETQEVGPDGAERETFESMGRLGPVRVFCWGEVVEHVYLLLYVASRSKIRKLKLIWVDAEEKVVIRMSSG